MKVTMISDEDLKDEILSELVELYNHDMYCRRIGKWGLVPSPIKMDEIYMTPQHKMLFDNAKKLCALFPNELFLAGGFLNLISCLEKENHHLAHIVPDLDFFIVAKSEERAIEIIRASIKCLLQNKDEYYGHFITRSKSALTYFEHFVSDEKDPDWFELAFEKHSMKFQFIHRLYSHYSQIPGMFDIGPSQIIYSHEHGIEVTQMANYCLNNSCMFLDPSRRSTSFFNRVVKYNNRGFNICVPNIKDSFPESNILLKVHSMNRKGLSKDNFSFIGKGKRDYEEEFFRISNILRYLYPHVPICESAPLIVEPENFTVDVETLSDIQKGLLKNPLWKKDLNTVHVKEFESFYGREKLGGKLNQIYTSPDPQKAWELESERLIQKRFKDLSNLHKPYSEGGFFITSNPGQQGGGSFRPTVMTGSEFWNPEKCNVVKVGISNETYWLLKQIWNKNTQGKFAPKDVFRLLCLATLKSLSPF